VLAFHGGGGTATGMQASSGLSALADRRGFLVAYPQGLAQDHGKAPPGWDASGPRDPFADGIDDGLFVSDLLNAVQAGYCVDPRRITATGISNGGSMAGYLACVLAGRIAVFAPVEGVFFQIPGGCRPAGPAAILDVHVLTDPVAPYAGVPSRGSPDYYALSIPAWLRAWALRDRCRTGPHVSGGSAEVTMTGWTGCSGGIGVTGYRLASGGHSWFRAIGALTGDAIILAFLAAHPLARPVPGWTPGQAAPVPVPAAPRITAVSVRKFQVPTAGAEPFDIAAGPAGTMWFTEFDADKVGRISRSGQITEYPVPTADAGPYQITAGPGGFMWFTEYNTTKLGRISPTGQVTEISLPRPSFGGTGITSGPGPAVWVADPAGSADRLAPSGAVTRTPLPSGPGLPFAIAASGGGSLVVSELTGYYEYSRVLVRIRPGRPVIQALTLPDRRSNIDALAAGSSGAVWFTDFGTSQVGELQPGGGFRLFGDEAPYAGLSDITSGPDGAMWYTEQAGLIGRITPAGTISQLALPGAGSNPDGIAAGPARTIWVTETGTDSVVCITLR
jgi:virginiamycin B lyase